MPSSLLSTPEEHEESDNTDNTDNEGIDGDSDDLERLCVMVTGRVLPSVSEIVRLITIGSTLTTGDLECGSVC